MEKIMKKAPLLALATAAALFLSLSPARADYQSRPFDKTWSNFYAGGYGGYGWTRAAQNPGPTLDVNGIDYGAFAGYEMGTLMSSDATGVTGALELHYGWSNASKTESGIEVKKDHEWGVDFRPGLTFVSNHMPMNLKPYGILGFRRTEFEQTTTGKEQFNGFALGVGTELVALNNFGTRLDYAHVFSESKDGLDPDENDLRLGLAFRF
jgi:opacity protein-like surface antigen